MRHMGEVGLNYEILIKNLKNLKDGIDVFFSKNVNQMDDMKWIS